MNSKLNHWMRLTCIKFLSAACLLMSAISPAVLADEFSWNAGNGSWHDANNWTPNGVPGAFSDVIWIGNLPGIQNSTVTLGAPVAAYQSLSISSGMTLDMAGGQLVSFDLLSISGANSRLLVRPSIGPNFHDLNTSLDLGFGAELELIDNARVRLFTSESAGIISGRGLLQLSSAVAFNNNGVIRPGINGGLEIFQGGILENPPNGLIDLDGSTETGSIQLQQQFSQLEIGASGLTDSFSSSITMAPGSLLTMNIDQGWEVDANGSISVAGFGNPDNATQVNGSPLTFGGTMNVGGNQGRLRILSDVTYAPTATVNIGQTDGLQMTGTTTVQGGQFSMGQGALLAFDGATNVQGGTFTTHSNDFADGFVAFNGPTNWRGTTTIDGVARQNGTATVNAALGGVINANVFDMDGAANNTTWNVNSGLVVNADRISTSLDNRFAGTMNIGGGFTGKLTTNLKGEDSPRWIMAGEMNLDGVAAAAFPIDRLAGSGVQVTGDVNVNHRVRISADAEFLNGSSLNFSSNSSLVQFTKNTELASNTLITGDGTLENGWGGTMRLGDGLALGTAGLQNRGWLQLGDAAGLVSVDRFENFDTGTWQVGIGGHFAGAEHDLMIVSGGPALLDGNLEVELLDLGLGTFLPAIGDTFTILTALAGVQGTFLENPITTLGSQNFHWDVIYNPHDVRLQLTAIKIPEPSSTLLIALAGIGLILRRRKRGVSGCSRYGTASSAFANFESPRSASRCKNLPRNALSGWEVKCLTGPWRGLIATFLGMICISSGITSNECRADDASWIAGNGLWSNSGNWSTGNVPGFSDQALLGNLPGIGGSTVFLNQGPSLSGLHLSSNMLLHTNGHQMSVTGGNGNTTITGDSSLIVTEGGFGLDFSTRNLGLVGPGSNLFLANGQVGVNGLVSLTNSATISGVGDLWLQAEGLTLFNNGIISSSGTTGELRILSGPNTGIFDLDGIVGSGQINVGGTGPTRVLFAGATLSDSFSGTINLGSDAELAINLFTGWEADASSTINVAKTIFSQPGIVLPSVISGTPATLAGQINVSDEALLWVESNATVTSTANAQIGNQGQLAFLGETTLHGGTFSTVSSSLTDGSVIFNGPTTWNGNVDIQGAAIQAGNANVTGQTTVQADRLVMDGFFGVTNWNVSHNLSVNADFISHDDSNRFTGTMNIAGGFFGQLNMNLSAPESSWTMAGQMNLSGNALAAFPITRLQGSAVRIEEDLNVNHQVRIAAPTTFASGSLTHFQSPNARLQSSAYAAVEAGALFSGGGTLNNGLHGKMELLFGTTLNGISLINAGELYLRGAGDQEIIGVASTENFVNESSGVWTLDIGGDNAGTEFDLLLATGTAELDGLLNVNLVDLGTGTFSPTIGDTFTILYAGNVAGQFLSDPVTEINGLQYQWQVIYNPHDVALQLVDIILAPSGPLGLPAVKVGGSTDGSK